MTAAVKPVPRDRTVWKAVMARCMLALHAEYNNVRALSACNDPMSALLLQETVRAHGVLTDLLAAWPAGGDWLARLRRVPLFAFAVFA